MSSLQSTVEHYQNWLNKSSNQEQYSHITDEERKTCQTKLTEVSTWMYQTMENQGKLQLWEDPIVNVSDLDGKRIELVRVVNPIMSKPVPKKEESEKKLEEKKESENEGDHNIQPMDTDEKKTNEIKTEPMDTSV